MRRLRFPGINIIVQLTARISTTTISCIGLVLLVPQSIKESSHGAAIAAVCLAIAVDLFEIFVILNRKREFSRMNCGWITMLNMCIMGLSAWGWMEAIYYGMQGDNSMEVYVRPTARGQLGTPYLTAWMLLCIGCPRIGYIVWSCVNFGNDHMIDLNAASRAEN